MTDPEVRREASSVLNSLFNGIGESAQGQQPSGGGINADWVLQQVQEFVEMPIDLALIFMEMSTQLTEMVLKALEQAGITLVRGLTPM